MTKLVVPDNIKNLVRMMPPSLNRKEKSSLKMITSDPHSGKALMDELSGLRSFKVGSFRIIYRMKGSEHIELVAIGPRERIYEETFKDHSKRGKNVIDGLLWVSPFCPSKKSGVSDIR